MKSYYTRCINLLIKNYPSPIAFKVAYQNTRMGIFPRYFFILLSKNYVPKRRNQKSYAPGAVVNRKKEFINRQNLHEKTYGAIM